jgi:hypothetical protein
MAMLTIFLKKYVTIILILKEHDILLIVVVKHVVILQCLQDLIWLCFFSIRKKKWQFNILGGPLKVMSKVSYVEIWHFT